MAKLYSLFRVKYFGLSLKRVGDSKKKIYKIENRNSYVSGQAQKGIKLCRKTENLTFLVVAKKIILLTLDPML
jgi:hypothetical protein